MTPDQTPTASAPSDFDLRLILILRGATDARFEWVRAAHRDGNHSAPELAGLIAVSKVMWEGVGLSELAEGLDIDPWPWARPARLLALSCISAAVTGRTPLRDRDFDPLPYQQMPGLDVRCGTPDHFDLVGDFHARSDTHLPELRAAVAAGDHDAVAEHARALVEPSIASVLDAERRGLTGLHLLDRDEDYCRRELSVVREIVLGAWAALIAPAEGKYLIPSEDDIWDWFNEDPVL